MKEPIDVSLTHGKILQSLLYLRRGKRLDSSMRTEQESHVFCPFLLMYVFGMCVSQKADCIFTELLHNYLYEQPYVFPLEFI